MAFTRQPMGKCPLLYIPRSVSRFGIHWRVLTIYHGSQLLYHAWFGIHWQVIIIIAKEAEKAFLYRSLNSVIGVSPVQVFPLVFA